MKKKKHKKDFIIENKFENNCKEHNLILNYFCFECKKEICSECFILNHSLHEIDFKNNNNLIIYKQKIKKELIFLKKENNQKLKEIQNDLNLIIIQFQKKTKEFEKLELNKNQLKSFENLIEKSKNVESIIGVLQKEIKKKINFSEEELPKIQSSKIEFLIEKYKNCINQTIINDKISENIQNDDKIHSSNFQEIKMENSKVKISKNLISDDLISNLVDFSKEEKRYENFDSFIVPNFQPQSIKQIISNQHDEKLDEEIETKIIFPFNQVLSNFKIIENK